MVNEQIVAFSYLCTIPPTFKTEPGYTNTQKTRAQLFKN